MDQEKSSSLEERIKLSKIRKIIGVAVLTLASLIGAYVVTNNSTPTVDSSFESDQEENSQKEKEQSNKNSYEIKEGFLEVYKGNSDDPELRIKLPKRFSELENHLLYAKKIIEDHPRKRTAARGHFEVFLDLKKYYKKISPDNKAFASLDPKEREDAVKAVNEGYINNIDELMEKGMPEGKYEVSKGIFNIYYKKPSNPNNPDIKITLPDKYLKLAEKIETMERHLKRRTYVYYFKDFLKNLSRERERFSKISPDNKVFEQLDSKEREVAANFVNNYLNSNLNILIKRLETELYGKTREGIEGSPDIF